MLGPRGGSQGSFSSCSPISLLQTLHIEVAAQERKCQSPPASVPRDTYSCSQAGRAKLTPGLGLHSPYVASSTGRIDGSVVRAACLYISDCEYDECVNEIEYEMSD